MKTLSDKFVVEADELPSQMEIREQKRRIECKFEAQCREVKGIIIKRAPVQLNPVADALKGLGI